MRLFVSYARVDKPYCIQIVDTLEIHDTWYDQRLYAGQDWWKEILRRLDWCEGFVYLLSPESIASEYCRREFELAHSLGRHIFPVVVHQDTIVPEPLRGIQYADLSKGLTVEAVKTLLNAIYRSENGERDSLPPDYPNDTGQPPRVDSTQVVANAVNALEAGQYDQAVFMLKQAKENGYHSRFINIDGILKEAENALERQTYLREADREYRQIMALVKGTRTRALGLEAFEVYREYFPDHDPENLISYTLKRNGKKPTGGLPLLSWCAIPGGSVNLQYVGQNKQLATVPFTVDDFHISQYPVTNAQFAAFIDDADGYSNKHWWDFSPQAAAWRESHTAPQPASFDGDERPRERVCWYEAMAYCNWLSDKLHIPITLPDIAQWQRAFQGDNELEFPWGNTFDTANCNTAESDLKMTTLVNAYENGVSPYGVYDMAGNVWEWCLNLSHKDDFDADPTRDGDRIVRGGSFISPGQRSRISFHYHLAPQSYYATTGFRIVTK